MPAKDILNNTKQFLKDAHHTSFIIKIIILFILYLVVNLVFDIITRTDLTKTFVENPYIVIHLPNNMTYKILISLFMIITSHFFYKYLIKPHINI
jgi:hypothetical protein